MTNILERKKYLLILANYSAPALTLAEQKLKASQAGSRTRNSNSFATPAILQARTMGPT